MDGKIFIGGGGEGYGEKQGLRLDYANRHGLIAGATGTGKTVTLQIMAEGFSAAGVPVVLADVKGDLSGLAASGSTEGKLHDAFMSRAATIGFDDFAYAAFPVIFWDLFGEQGHPIRTTISEMGPLLLSRLLELTEAQEGVMNIAFRAADEEGLPLLDLKDLRALLVWVGENRADLGLRYGNISPQSVGAIQRALLVLETQGGEALFGEPALELADLMRTDIDGRGMVLDPRRRPADGLAPALRDLPALAAVRALRAAARGRRSRQAEARLLLRRGAPAVRGRPEGADRQGRAGRPADPLQGCRRLLLHPEPCGCARRRAGPAWQPGPARAPCLHRQRPQGAETGGGDLSRQSALLDRGGDPRGRHRRGGDLLPREEGRAGHGRADAGAPPSSQLGPISGAARAARIESSPVAGKYDTAIDRVSAHEILLDRAKTAAKAAEESEAREEAAEAEEREFRKARRYSGSRVPRSSSRGSSSVDSFGEAISTAVIKELQGTTGRRIVRGILGGLFRSR